MCITIIMFFICFLVGCGEKAFSEDPEAIEVASESVVELTIYDKDGNMIASGSGFFSFDSATIVTNYHVIEGAYRIEAIDDNNNIIAIDTIYNYDEEKDIAIVQVDTEESTYKPLTLAESKDIQRGESVVAIGSPLGIKNTVSTGTISNIIELDGMGMIQFTAAISSGSSGGALFNNFGEVIGITSASYVEGQNLNLAVPATEIITLYNSQPILSSVTEYYEDTVIPTIQSGVLTVGVSADFPPYEYIDDSGNYEGIEVEIISQVANRLNQEVVFVNMEFSNLLNSLIDEEVDCIIGLDYEPLRLEYANASNPVFIDDLGDGVTYTSVIYITKSNFELQTEINNTIRELQENGIIDDIINNY